MSTSENLPAPGLSDRLVYGAWKVDDPGGAARMLYTDMIIFDQFHEFKFHIRDLNNWLDVIPKYVFGKLVTGKWSIENDYIIIEIGDLPNVPFFARGGMPIPFVFKCLHRTLGWFGGNTTRFHVQVVSEMELLLSFTPNKHESPSSIILRRA
jgi:hypothetical protein